MYIYTLRGRIIHTLWGRNATFWLLHTFRRVCYILSDEPFTLRVTGSFTLRVTGKINGMFNLCFYLCKLVK